jgi:hypothetical protein
MLAALFDVNAPAPAAIRRAGAASPESGVLEAAVEGEAIPMARVAIIGSCITRDLWPVRGDSSDGPLYVSRTSLASLMAPPVAGFESSAQPPAELARHQHRAVVADLQKTALRELLAYRPTHLIFDFIDERFDLLAVGGTTVTHSWELEVSGYLDQPALAGRRPAPRLSLAADLLWRQGLESFAGLLRCTPLGQARLILHSARWAYQSRRASGRPRPLSGVEILKGQPADIAAHNALLARYEAEFLSLTPVCDVVAAPKRRIADEGHRWGLSPFHYVPTYYAEIWRQLQRLGVPPPVSVALDGPNAPAA